MDHGPSWFITSFPQQSKNTCGATRSVFYLDWRHNHKGSSCRNTSEICNILQMEFALAVSNVVDHEIRRHAVIHAECIDADTRNVSLLSQQLCRVIGESSEIVSGSLCLYI